MYKIIRFVFALLFSFSSLSGCIAAEKEAKQFSEAQVFTLNDLSGKAVSLSDYRDKKPVVLIFWTTWCPYCRMALKSLKDSEYVSQSKDFELLAVNVGESKSKVENFVKANGFRFKVLLDLDSQVADSYGLLGVPTYYVINKSGLIVFEGNRLQEKRIQELVSK